MSDKQFVKFPRTPYLIEPSVLTSRQDKVLTKEEAMPFFSESVIIEEKIDGANLGISFNVDGTICLQNRGHYLSHPFSGQWELLPNWLNGKSDSLFDVLLDRYILFGEWCYVTHSIYYENLPDWFIAFDLFDKESNQFLSVNDRNYLIDKIGLVIVPQLYKGQITKLALNSFIGRSSYSKEYCEGLYFRIDSDHYNRRRAKYVRSDFVQSINSHWSKSQITHNRLYGLNTNNILDWHIE